MDITCERAGRAAVTWYPNVRALTAEPADPDESASLTIPYAVGILSWPALRDLIAYGATFADVRNHPSGGLLTRRGYIRVRGPWRNVRRFALLLERMEKQTTIADGKP